MFEGFKEKCNGKISLSQIALNECSCHGFSNEMKQLFFEIGGYSFENGAFYVFAKREICEWADAIKFLFPSADTYIPVGRDWLNRLYAVRQENDFSSDVILFSHITDEFFSLGVNIRQFFDSFLINEYETLLDMTIFGEFVASNDITLPLIQSGIQMKIPLFLGGDYSVANMELVDPKMDWDIVTQLLLQTREMEVGQSVSGVEIVLVN